MDEPRGRPIRWKRWLKRLAWSALITIVLLTGFIIWALTTCVARPPALRGHPTILDAATTVDATGRVHLGKSWFQQRRGRSLLYVEGDPFTLGYSNATLTADLLEQQERILMETVRTFLPGTISFYSAALLVLVHNRNLPEFVADEYKMEIHGLSAHPGTDPYPHLGNRYHRILNYHAAHDISHWLWDQPALGCTCFAAVGKRTTSGHLIVGRNFDWESGEHFDTNKVIALYRPTKGHAFLSVSWPGMAGVVTGINDAKIYCSINGAHTEHMGLGVGRPVALVVRELLQYTDDLSSATAVIEQAPVFVADTFLVADGKTGTAIVVEKTPKSCSVRHMSAELLLQTNHFESEAIHSDTGNLEYMRDGTSLPRHDRLAELLTRHSGAIDPRTTATILRDRRGVGDVPRGLGHRATINPMIATHSVIADVTAGVLWVSRGPHQLGIYDAYDIEHFGTPVNEPLPADPALADGAFDRLTRYRKLLRTVEAAMGAGQNPGETVRQQLARAARLNPRAPEVLRLKARRLEHDGELDEALAMYRATRAAWPAFRPDRLALDAIIHRLETRQRK